jgi:hypothetical protein
MANTYTWNCKTVDVYPSYESQTDVVYNVHWILKGESDQQDSEGNNYMATVYNSQTLSLEDIGSNFIPFADLTNATVAGWVESALGTEKINELKSAIDDKIDEQINPTSETKIIGE